MTADGVDGSAARPSLAGPTSTTREPHAYYCDTRDITPARVQALWRLLSRDERRRADRAVSTEDRRDYVAAHALLRLALAAHLRTRPERLAFKTDARGRPWLVPGDEPSTPASFSLSHSRDLVACIVASGCPVGIDVERRVSSVRPMAVARACFSVEEVAGLERCAAPDRSVRFYELWTLKEALLKAMGVGLTVPLDLASFRVDASRRHVSVAVRPPLAPGSWSFAVTEVAGTHVLAIALGAPLAPASGLHPAKTDLFAWMAGRATGCRGSAPSPSDWP